MIYQSFSASRAYCGCCRTEMADSEVETGICLDCFDSCYHRPDGKCAKAPASPGPDPAGK